MDVIVGLFASHGAQRGVLQDYAGFSRHNQVVKPYSNSPAIYGLGEPKFYVTGPVFDGTWGRPQNDGPALRAIVLIKFADLLLNSGSAPDEQYVRSILYDGKLPTGSVIKADLEYVSHNWPNKDVDLWEEISGCHFFTRMAQHRALVDGARLADRLGDGGAANYYRQQAQALRPEVEKHWDAYQKQIIATREVQGHDFKPSQLDASIIVAVLRTRSSDEPLFSPVDDRVLATAHKLATEFRKLYPINNIRSNAEDRALQPAIGRYPEDQYDGYRRESYTLGNRWFLATAAMAELCYQVADDWAAAGKLTITDLNVDFVNSALASLGSAITVKPGSAAQKGDARFKEIIAALVELGDGYLRRIQFHCDQSDGWLSEQFNRDTGFIQGAPNLTWSYAAVLTAFEQRATAQAKLEQLEMQPVTP